jgi:hypothetical protein
LDKIIKWLSAVLEATCNVISDREGLFDDRVAVAAEGGGLLVERFELTEHLRHVGVLRPLC